MMLEHAFDIASDCNSLQGIAEQVSDHANATSVRQLDEHGEVGTVLAQRCVRRMPDPLPTEDAAARRDLGPLGVEGMAAVTQPFRAELPRPAMRAALHQEAVLAQPRPIGRRQAVRLGHRDRQAGRKIRSAGLVLHSVASEPSRRLLTGVTIGPPMTMATSLRLAWLVDVPRTCRTASSTSSNPCM